MSDFAAKANSGVASAQATINAEAAEAVAAATTADNIAELQAKEAQQEKGPKSSKFCQLRAQLAEAQDIADYVTANYNKDALVHHRGLAAFMQAISNRDDALYLELFGAHRAQALYLLDKLSQWKASVAFTAFGHEFVIRAEAHGVKKAAWAENMPVLPDVAVPLLSAEAMCAAISDRDMLGKLSRRIEICKSGTDLRRTGKALGQPAVTEKLTLVQQSLLIGKLLSKARRVETAFAEGDNCADALIELCRLACVEGGVPPPGKLQHFLEHVQAKGHATAATDAAVLERLLEVVTSGVESQVMRMGVVMQLKSCASAAELQTVLDEVAPAPEADDEAADAGAERALSTRTVDVLSALAVAVVSLRERAIKDKADAIVLRKEIAEATAELLVQEAKMAKKDAARQRWQEKVAAEAAAKAIVDAAEAAAKALVDAAEAAKAAEEKAAEKAAKRAAGEAVSESDADEEAPAEAEAPVAAPEATEEATEEVAVEVAEDVVKAAASGSDAASEEADGEDEDDDEAAEVDAALLESLAVVVVKVLVRAAKDNGAALPRRAQRFVDGEQRAAKAAAKRQREEDEEDEEEA
jgi:hypothetical protein